MPDPLDKQLVEAVLTRPRRARADVEEAKLATRGLRVPPVRILPGAAQGSRFRLIRAILAFGLDQPGELTPSRSFPMGRSPRIGWPEVQRKERMCPTRFACPRSRSG